MINQARVRAFPQSIAGRAELAWYTLTRALITGVARCFTPGCVLVALTGLARCRARCARRDQGTEETKGRASFARFAFLRKTAKLPPGSAAAKPLNSCKFVLFVVSFLRSFPTFLTFLRQNCQNENFSSHRFLGRFGAVFVSFARLCGFQITHCQSMSYLENRPLSTRLQRLPGQKMPARDPL